MRQVLLLVVASCLAAVPLGAQTANQAQLRLVVVDETGAGIPNATVVVTPLAGEPITVMSDERGLVTVQGLAPGPVQLHVEFPGFTAHDAPVNLRRGANNQNVTLGIAGLQEEVVVSDLAATDDRSGNAQTTTLEQDEIDALPDDPDELALALQQMTGGSGATFQVNGFRGGRLPAREEIRQIRFRTNSFAADNHDAGRTQIEIITRPNVREWSGNANMGYRSSEFNAKNAFARLQTPEEIRRFNMSLRGPLVTGKTSLRLSVDGNRAYDTPVIFAVNEDRTIYRDQVRRPSEFTNVTAGLEHALTGNQTLRFEFRRSQNEATNQGVGDYTFPERAVERSGSGNQVRFQIQGLIGKTTLHEVRVQFNAQANEAHSVTGGPSINVIETFYKGGAGVNNNGSSKILEVADNLDFNLGRKHAMRVGLLFEGGSYDNFDARNAAGTFTFSSLDTYLAGTPLQFTQRNGEVDTSFSQYQLGLYWQDDIRVNRNFSFSLGVRQEMQSLIDDKLNVMPRLGFSWNAPGAVVVRGGYGIFYDWYETSLYDQTLRVNGVSQRDLLIINPGYPNPFLGADPTILPGGRIQESPDLSMPYIHQASIGVERALTQNLQLQASYQMLRGRNLMRSINVNAPDESGERPEPNIGTVTQFESSGRSQSDRFQVGLNYRVPQRRIFFGGNYTLGQVKNHADSATSLPANSLDPDAEWGPSLQDIRHRANFNFNMPFVFGMRANFNGFAQSAAPYNITTGRDDNLDGVVNDRPAGVGRNAARGASRFDMTIRLSRQFGFGPARTTPGGPGGRQGGGGGRGGGGAAQQVQGPGGPGGPGGGAGNPFGANQRFSAELWISANNVLNRVNYLNFVGNIQSPFFGTATSAAPPRRIEVGVNFRF
jgi:hypothetical protein